MSEISSSSTEVGKISQNSKEYIKDCQDLQRNHDTKQAPLIAQARTELSERAVRRVKERNSNHFSAKRTTSRMVELCNGTQLLLAQRARSSGRWARQQSRRYMVSNVMDHQSLRNWLSTSQLPRQTSQEYIRFEWHILRLCALCGVQGGCET